MAATRRRDTVRSTVRRDDQEGNDSEEWRSGTTMDRVRFRRDEERSYGVRLERAGGGRRGEQRKHVSHEQRAERRTKKSACVWCSALSRNWEMCYACVGARKGLRATRKLRFCHWSAFFVSASESENRSGVEVSPPRARAQRSVKG